MVYLSWNKKTSWKCWCCWIEKKGMTFMKLYAWTDTNIHCSRQCDLKQYLWKSYDCNIRSFLCQVDSSELLGEQICYFYCEPQLWTTTVTTKGLNCSNSLTHNQYHHHHLLEIPCLASRNEHIFADKNLISSLETNNGSKLLSIWLIWCMTVFLKVSEETINCLLMLLLQTRFPWGVIGYCIYLIFVCNC